MNTAAEHTGTLFIVPTPIGNLEDITVRAIRVLREAPVIACEDTRVTGRLLTHLEIEKPRLISLFARNESGRIGEVLAILRGGADVALASDAGTPGISDPGTRLISAAIGEGIRVEPLPGPTAFVTAIVGSGFPTDAFVFEGFLPHKKGRQTMLRRLAEEPRTVVLYESPHRIVKLLGEIVEHFGAERRVVVARELTKLHEEFIRDTAARAAHELESRAAVRGEFVVVIEGSGN